MNLARLTLVAGLLGFCACRQIAGIDDLSELDQLRQREESPCTTHRECSERFDAPYLCRSDARCVPLLSDECSEISGDAKAQEAVILGSIEPVTGLDAATGRSVRRALRLAVEDFELGSKGLPPLPGTSTRRPLAFVHCNDEGQSSTALRAARHLTETLQLPAIVGATFSGITLDVASEVTIASRTLLISPSATSSAISDLEDHGLVWRTAASDVVQARAQAVLLQRLADRLREQRAEPTAPLTLVVVHKGDAYGYGLAEDVLEDLMWNGRRALDARNIPYVIRKDYGDPSDATSNPVKYARVVRETLAFLPDVALIYGTAEAATDILQPIEASWPEDHARPQYLLADGGRVDELRDAIGTVDPDGRHTLASRIVGTEPGSLSQEQALFASRYVSSADDPDEPVAFGASNAYDAAHLLAYAVAKVAHAQLSGTDLAQALKDMLPVAGEDSAAFSIGPRSLNAIFRALREGKRLMLAGASGPLSFDLETGDVMSDILLWCPQLDSRERLRLASYGERYDPTLMSIVAEGELGQCGQ